MRRRPVYLALATTSLLVISGAGAYAQTLAPSTLHLTSPDQETRKDTVQATAKEPTQATAKEPIKTIAKEPIKTIAKEPVKAVTKEPVKAIAKEPVKAVTKEPVKAVTKKPERTINAEPVFAMEPVRAMAKPDRSETTGFVARYSYKTPQGKKESAPVITQYYPKRIVYPFAKVDRHIDRKLMQAATIAQERAHAHSRSRCWHYVKEALLASGVIDSRPKSAYAKEAAQELVTNYGFKKLPVNDPFAAPVGSVLVYGAKRAAGHVEIRTRDGFVSDFRSKTPSPRPLLGVFAKL
jgi:hypothetical protein